ncbi:MAG: hypothetical protein K0U49_11505 [Alphaproteobacteria bacterium]|nr:hypothetical protein [Alphaproteobacteria bacterium]
MNQEQYDWIPFFEAIADGLLRHKDDRTALLKEFYEIANAESYKGTGTVYTDKYKGGGEGHFRDIDPFTVIALLMRVGDKKRDFASKKLAKFLQINTNIDVVKCYTGVPKIRPNKCWFFAFEESRKNDDIDFHWNLLEKAIYFANNKNNNIAEKAFITAFDESLGVKQVGQKHLTMSLFWIRPNFFPVLNTPVSKYIKRKWQIPVTPKINGAEYLEIRKKLIRKTNCAFPKISQTAYQEKNLP